MNLRPSTILRASLIAIVMMTGACTNDTKPRDPEYRTTPHILDVGTVTEKEYRRGSEYFQKGQLKKINYKGDIYPDDYFIAIKPDNDNIVFVGIDDCELFDSVEIGDKVMVEYHKILKAYRADDGTQQWYVTEYDFDNANPLPK